MTARAEWGSGPWNDEPDAVDWIDPSTGLRCAARRGGGGAWCGYVQVAEGHAWNRDDYEALGADVHGGLTFGGVPRACEGGFWLGFDCGHFGDLRPGDTVLRRAGFDVLCHGDYRTLDYVRGECSSLAAQIAEAAQ